MATITFKAKVQTVYNMDDTEAFKYVAVPNFTKSHCDMDSFRKHPKFGGLANSDLFKNVLARIKRDNFKNDMVKLDNIPANVTIDTSKFLAVVTVEV